VRVFISYAWEDDDYRLLVKRLATRLCSDGIDARLDAWHLQGTTIPEFMNREVRKADKVLVVCSPLYQSKIHAMEDGEHVSGVGWEGMLVTSALYTEVLGRDRLQPVLLRGTWKQAAPLFLQGIPYIDLSNEEHFEGNYRDLLRKLTGHVESQPSLGQLPSNLSPQSIEPLLFANASRQRTIPVPAHLPQMAKSRNRWVAVVATTITLIVVVCLLISLQLRDQIWSQILASLVACCVAFATLFYSAQQANQMLQNARDQLQDRILARSTQPELMTASSLRGLAKGIQIALRCPVIPDGLVIEAIRCAALEAEGKYMGAPLRQRLELMNSAILAFDKTALPLLSFAYVDRILAYKLSGTIIIVCIAIAQFVIEFILLAFHLGFAGHLVRVLLVTSFCFFTGCYLLIAAANVRATLFWNPKVTDSRKSFLRRLIEPKVFHVFPDLLAYTAQSDDHDFVHARWGVWWESIIIVPLALRWTPTVFSQRFTAWHEYKHFEVEKLAKMANRLRQQLLVSSRRVESSERKLRQYREICARIWVITGSPEYRTDGRFAEPSSEAVVELSRPDQARRSSQ